MPPLPAKLGVQDISEAQETVLQATREMLDQSCGRYVITLISSCCMFSYNCMVTSILIDEVASSDDMDDEGPALPVIKTSVDSGNADMPDNGSSLMQVG